MKDVDFVYPDTTPKPALTGEDVTIRQTPQDICGHFAELLKRHYSAQVKCENDEQRDKALARAGISYEDRQLVAGLLKGLREHGYYITGQDSVGRIVLGIVTDSMHEHMQNLDPVVPLTKGMVTAFRKKVERGLMKVVKKVTRDELNYEKQKMNHTSTEF